MEDEVVLVNWRARSSIVGKFCLLEVGAAKAAPHPKVDPSKREGTAARGHRRKLRRSTLEGGECRRRERRRSGIRGALRQM